ncbi:electron transfer flavoprotein subunit alpha/FixB family protein [Flavilitoribacter nigricans]|uniref:Electron transfer flavoprotein subunit alpha n=1 Tax=Flavilitoribacter nigricans (strain ATCC 23147 / DSM 23189 / NBRC 102662 / NCIMB 1420 / SS-2) TaxID=1122177 RepID=A0A2D0N9I8_FLAN2|nr:electron transfer flavoprotein subunit alpha/FixB family protein [Flavilitoribacter nigricans]PHN05048.1 electron transfer flavoprotein subunit alpha [Flavilitoribacter nigricans DSM 23189 = NBRC 102662]
MVLVFAETQKGKLKKAAFEAVTYGYRTAQALGSECVALVIGAAEDAGQLGKYGASKVYQVEDPALEKFDSQTYTRAIAGAAKELDAKVLVLSHSTTGKSLLGRLAARLDAGSVPGVNAVPTTDGGFKVRKPVFSGKAIAEMEIKTDVKVLSLMGNAIQPEVVGDNVGVEALSVPVEAGRITVKDVERVEGTVPLPEAELVVSAGRGMKGPENWGIIEELAEVLGATTACSRPVADTGWRPHHEHVGQTGIAIRPNLYIAAGISGAIQHLAGVNNSKTIVVINKDPDAPFFKAADYGVVGDLFEVVPRLTEALKKFKAEN